MQFSKSLSFFICQFFNIELIHFKLKRSLIPMEHSYHIYYFYNFLLLTFCLMKKLQKIKTENLFLIFYIALR